MKKKGGDGRKMRYKVIYNYESGGNIYNEGFFCDEKELLEYWTVDPDELPKRRGEEKEILLDSISLDRLKIKRIE